MPCNNWKNWQWKEHRFLKWFLIMNVGPVQDVENSNIVGARRAVNYWNFDHRTDNLQHCRMSKM
jgi:hypothetical protein